MINPLVCIKAIKTKILEVLVFKVKFWKLFTKMVVHYISSGFVKENLVPPMLNELCTSEKPTAKHGQRDSNIL